MNQSGALGYADAVALLHGRGRFGVHLGLGRTRALLRALGDPEAEIRGALIAGTNGKGSVQALVASMLQAAGYRVGQAPKPHLVEYRERIVVDGRPIAADRFASLLTRTLELANALPRRLGPPTEFEVLTAAAFEWFAASRVAVAVVEVGLGGRLDATNAWDGGVAAITNVAMDHAEVLGGTIPAIAREKAAILKRGDVGVTGAVGEALAVVRRRARRLGAPLAETAPLRVLGMDRRGLVVDVPSLGEVRLGLLGRHQAANAAVALGVVDALEQAGVARVPEAARREGLASARWPGRLELIELRPAAMPRATASNASRPRQTVAGSTPIESRGVWEVSTGRAPGAEPGASVEILLDGAHNPAGVEALVAALDELRPSLAPGRVTLLMAVMRDKDVVGMMGRLVASQALHDARLLATQVGERGLEAEALGNAWLGARRSAGLPDGKLLRFEVPEAALDRGIDLARGSGGPLVVMGSLYLVGAVRGILQSRGHLA
ncbi:MAG: bifunctional folylpolyglutamate synthase/dihydrofolate synthase [Candidatus Limnocylindrales bacterium]